METITEVREDLIDYIARADDEKVKAMYTLVREDANRIELTTEHRKLIEEALELDRVGATYTPWSEVLQKIRGDHGL